MRLSPVLAAADLTSAELQCARLDAEVYDLADGFCLIGELESPAHRTRAALQSRSPRLIAQLGTAAWIWGVAPEPRRLEFSVTPEARARLSPADHIVVREIVYESGDLVVVDGFRVTTPLRTALDLARFAEPFDPLTVSRLVALAGLDLAGCLDALDRRTGLPAKHRARQRLQLALAPPEGQAVETR